MTISLTDLLSLKTADQLFNDMLGLMSGAGLKVANWRTGGPYRTLIKIESVILEKLHQVQVAFTQGGYLRSATGGWLTLLAQGFYGEERMPSLFAEGNVTLSASAGAGPYTISPGAVIVSTPSGLKYRSINTAPVVLPAGGSVTLPVRAAAPGSIYNVGVGNISQLDAPTLLGVNVANGADWQTVAGADEEGDEKLVERCLNKWGTQALDLPADAGLTVNAQSAVVAAGFIYLALSASAQIAKVGVHSNLLDGAFAANYVTLVLGGDGAVPSDAAVTAVRTLIDQRIMIGTKVAYKKASLRTIAVAGTVYGAPLYLDEIRAKVGASLTDLQRRLPLGATVYKDRIIGAIHYSDLVNGAKVPGKVQHATLTSPAVDTVLTYLEIAQLANGLTFVGM